eukprot:9080414-Alexandrium_andersonii.AAC.1
MPEAVHMANGNLATLSQWPRPAARTAESDQAQAAQRAAAALASTGEVKAFEALEVSDEEQTPA